MVERRSPKPEVAGSIPVAPASLYKFGDSVLTNAVDFIKQIRQEASKVTWSTRKEVITSTILVLVMVLISSIFFLIVDGIIFNLTQLIMGF